MTIEMQIMQVFAPAKINLSLKILGDRGDGFHEIETLITPISLCDELRIKKSDSEQRIEFRCDDPTFNGPGESCRSCGKSFCCHKVRAAVSIELKENPAWRGLGGGSSDAATTLLALNQLFETNLARDELARLGSAVGSDVPFFIFESAALCRGRGELVAPTKLPEPLSILLVKPGFGIASGWAYSHWHDSREVPGVTSAAQEFAGQTFVNDLERPAFEKFIFLAQLKMWLLRQPEVGAVLMAGSGSTVFAVTRPNVDGDLVAKRARGEIDPELWICACQTLGGSSSPLLDVK
jgi:4-diphosphocytidyl-2-C-methyl-D-erythritol kinase